MQSDIFEFENLPASKRALFLNIFIDILESPRNLYKFPRFVVSTLKRTVSELRLLLQIVLKPSFEAISAEELLAKIAYSGDVGEFSANCALKQIWDDWRY